MKRWIHASNEWAMYRLAKDTLKKYSDEQIDYVRECYDEVLEDISNHYTWDDMDGDAPQIHTNSIKTDYLIGAIEDDLMEEEDFEDIYTAMEVLGELDAMAYA